MVNSVFMSSNCASIGFCVSLHTGGRWLFRTLLSDFFSDFMMLGRDLVKMRIDCNLLIALQPFVTFENLEYPIRILQESAFTRTIHPKTKIKWRKRKCSFVQSWDILGRKTGHH